MEKEEFENYIKAGKILKQVQEKARKIIAPEKKLLEIAEALEKEIYSLEAKPAFPANLSLNNSAAHYTPSIGDETVLKKTDVMKVDLGVQIDGYIADGAFTVNFSNDFAKMIEASEKALENALAVVKIGVPIGKIGEEIEKTIKSYGFNPINNLSGHGLEQYTTHAAPTIPNIRQNDERVVEDEIAFAIEPFATNGTGYVRESNQVEIFSIDKIQPTRNMHARKIIEFAEKEFSTLPFAERWLEKISLTEFQRKTALRELMQKKSIHIYPVLNESAGKIVTQAENTIVIHEGKVNITI